MSYDRALARRGRHARQLRPGDVGARLRGRATRRAKRGGASARSCSIARWRALDWLEYPRAQAYAMLGLAHALRRRRDAGYARRALRRSRESLAARYERERQRRVGVVRDRDDLRQRAACPKRCFAPATRSTTPRYSTIGLAHAGVLRSVTVFEDGIFVPIGNDGWYPARRAARPLRAAAARSCAMVDAELAAFDATGDARAPRRRANSRWRGITEKISLRRHDGARRRMLRWAWKQTVRTATWAPNRRLHCSRLPSLAGRTRKQYELPRTSRRDVTLAANDECSWRLKLSTTCNQRPSSKPMARF